MCRGLLKDVLDMSTHYNDHNHSSYLMNSVFSTTSGSANSRISVNWLIARSHPHRTFFLGGGSVRSNAAVITVSAKK